MIWFVLVDSSRILRSVYRMWCWSMSGYPLGEEAQGGGHKAEARHDGISFPGSFHNSKTQSTTGGGGMWRQADGHVRDSGMW